MMVDGSDNEEEDEDDDDDDDNDNNETDDDDDDNDDDDNDDDGDNDDVNNGDKDDVNNGNKDDVNDGDNDDVNDGEAVIQARTFAPEEEHGGTEALVARLEVVFEGGQVVLSCVLNALGVLGGCESGALTKQQELLGRF